MQRLLLCASFVFLIFMFLFSFLTELRKERTFYKQRQLNNKIDRMRLDEECIETMEIYSRE